MTVQLFQKVCNECSKAVTINYSTSFSSAIRLLHPELRTPVFNVYGFVRLADEVVDTFHDFDKEKLLGQLKDETYDSISRGLSLNPILDSFQQTVNRFQIENALIEAFFSSMEADLSKNAYNSNEYREYIYGSAEVVGLMCLRVFCDGNEALYRQLTPSARALGAAFQKVNFLRDMRDDYNGLARVYFPGCDFLNFTLEEKQKIEQEIREDFAEAMKGIIRLPVKARFGVYVAYKYYYSLFKKIESKAPAHILQERVRIPDYHKAYIVLRASVKNSLRLI